MSGPFPTTAVFSTLRCKWHGKKNGKLPETPSGLRRNAWPWHSASLRESATANKRGGRGCPPRSLHLALALRHTRKFQTAPYHNISLLIRTSSIIRCSASASTARVNPCAVADDTSSLRLPIHEYHRQLNASRYRCCALRYPPYGFAFGDPVQSGFSTKFEISSPTRGGTEAAIRSTSTRPSITVHIPHLGSRFCSPIILSSAFSYRWLLV